MSTPIIFYNNKNPIPLICDNCKKEFDFPVGIDGIGRLENTIFMCSIKCWQQYKGANH